MNVKLLQSMTGFGVAQGVVAGCEFSVKVRTLNGRFLECFVKMPSQFLELEVELRKRAQSVFRRGKVEVQIYLKLAANTAMSANGTPTLNKDLLEKYKQVYLTASYEIVGVHSALTNLEANEILRRPGVLSLPQEEVGEYSLGVDTEAKSLFRQELIACLWKLVDEAFYKTSQSREVEGKEIQGNVGEIVQSLQDLLETVQQLSKPIVANNIARLRARMAEILQGVSVDESRIAQEAAVMADRYDVAEELQRFDAHLKLIRSTLYNGMGGKQLEFLCQELVREVNTIGAKVQHSEIQHTVVEMKGFVERLREQAQNIE